MRTVEFYGPLRLYLAEKDDATSPTLCLATKNGLARTTILDATVYKDAYHGFEDRVPIHKFNGWRMGYNPAAANGTIRGILAELRKSRN